MAAGYERAPPPRPVRRPDRDGRRPERVPGGDPQRAPDLGADLHPASDAARAQPAPVQGSPPSRCTWPSATSRASGRHPRALASSAPSACHPVWGPTTKSELKPMELLLPTHFIGHSRRSPSPVPAAQRQPQREPEPQLPQNPEGARVFPCEEAASSNIEREWRAPVAV